MAVCVVCLLCAEHLPCKEHLDNSNPTTKSNLAKLESPTNHGSSNNPNSINEEILNSKLSSSDVLRIENAYRKPRGRTKSTLNESQAKNRSKRHAHHHHSHDEEESSNAPGNIISRDFLKKIFQQFGDTEGRTMDLNGFEKMLTHLRLYNLIEDRVQEDETAIKASKASEMEAITSSTVNDSCISSLELINRISPTSSSSNPIITHDHEDPDSNRGQHNDEHAHDSTTTTVINETTATKPRTEDHDVKSRVFVNSNDLYNICPILLYQLIAPTPLEKSGCIASDLIPKYNVKPIDELIEIENRFSVWLYAIISVLGVSLVGLLGVAVIPCMDRHFYQHIIQFLVALAVGTLAGDALLHLLPHAMVSIEMEDDHSGMAWKGLIAVIGIIFFFATERGLTMIAEWRKKIEKKEKPSSRVRVMRDPDSASINNSTAGDKLCKDRYNSYPYCYNEIAMETKEDHYHHHNQKSNRESMSGTPLSKKKNNCNTYNNTCNDNNVVKDTKDHGDHNENAQKLLQNIDVDGDRDKVRPYQEETYTIILREHESSHHGHSHKHGHVHSPPRSLSAVAWMVVMGDGLHNFTDGMAIGAAFSNNIAGGFSTAIAVFCHELPHELGDFAVLLKAGMTAKQAVYYNLLSSVLSFLGMILGIIIGETPEASAWVFACAAGMFLYIALVDMMPELTSAHNERCALSQCVLQILGMCTGLGVMLLIALFEDDLKNMF